jgi:hypothetical protein
MKQCTKCGEFQGHDEFQKGRAQCKACRRQYMATYTATNKKQILAKKKEWYNKLDQKERWERVKKTIESSPEAFLADQMYHIVSRSNKPEYPPNPSDPKKREFDLDRAYLQELWDKQGGKCAITGIPMVYKFGCLESASIDRVDSSLGHVKGNIQLVCLGINRLKSTFSNDEVRRFLGAVSQLLCATPTPTTSKSPSSSRVPM